MLAGHGRLEAAKALGFEAVPTLIIAGLSEAKKLAYRIADNRIAEGAGWDRRLLVTELEAIIDLDVDMDLTITGLASAEIDLQLQDVDSGSSDQDDIVELPEGGERPVARLGDLWLLGEHRLLCADATDLANLDRLMAGDPARVVLTDSPYNVPIDGHVGGKGRIRHRDFAMASGEMTPEALEAFLVRSLKGAMAHSASGALLYVFMDARHLRELLEAGRTLGLNYLNLVVWAKTNAGMGSLYRSQHELIAIFKAGRGRHVNNVELGRHGRNRTNVWTYPGVNTFRKGRLEDLAAHPTVKPMALVADAILDVTNRGDVVLDPFAGSGTTILAAERTGRKAHAIEIDPLYVDVAIRRWQERTGQSATLDATGQTFDEVAAARAGEGEARGRPRPLSPRAGSSRRIPGAQAVTVGGTNATAKPGSRP